MKTLISFKYRGKSEMPDIVKKADFGLIFKLVCNAAYVAVQKKCLIWSKS